MYIRTLVVGLALLAPTTGLADDRDPSVTVSPLSQTAGVTIEDDAPSDCGDLEPGAESLCGPHVLLFNDGLPESVSLSLTFEDAQGNTWERAGTILLAPTEPSD